MKKNIKEAIDYSRLGQGGERMSPKDEERLRTRGFPLAASSAMPDAPRDGIASNFAELAASESFQTAILKLRQYTGYRSVGKDKVSELYSMFSAAYADIHKIEVSKKEYLQDLAVDLVCREFGIESGELEFNADLITDSASVGKIDYKERGQDLDEIVQNFTANQENIDETEALVNALNNFKLEVEKRRLINSIIQGAARKGENLFHLVQQELNAINPRLFDLYCLVIAFNNYLYWMEDTDSLQSLMTNGGALTGMVDVDYSEDGEGMVVNARATMFPVLLHELVKGVYEVLGMSGLPSDRGGEMVVQEADDPRQEIWDLRLGSVIYSKIIAAYPEDLIVDEKKRYIGHMLTQKFFKLPADEFLKLAKLLLGGSPSGARMLQGMVDEIVEMLKQYDAENDEEKQDLSGFNFDDDDDLSSM